MNNLVQVGTGCWVNPAEVLRVYTCDTRSGRTTFISCSRLDGPLQLMSSVINTHTIVSDWPAERVESALGLTPLSALEEMQ